MNCYTHSKKKYQKTPKSEYVPGHYFRLLKTKIELQIQMIFPHQKKLSTLIIIKTILSLEILTWF